MSRGHAKRGYNRQFACFSCRKMFRKANNYVISNAGVLCPECGQSMAEVGLDFRPPKQTKREEWQVAQILIANNIRYFATYRGGVGYRPHRLQEVATFLREQFPPTPGQLLLERFRAIATYKSGG